MRKTRSNRILLAATVAAASLLAGVHAGMNLLSLPFAWYLLSTVFVASATGLALAVYARWHRAGLSPSAYRQIQVLPDPKGCEPVPVRVVGRHAGAQRLRLQSHPRALRRSG